MEFPGSTQRREEEFGVKARELLYLFGLKPGVKTFGFEIRTFDLRTEGRVEYAQWLHPRESEKQITQEMVDELRRFLSPGDVAIDIGAHTGDSTLPIALAVGGAGCVLALEPNKYVFPVLQKNVFVGLKGDRKSTRLNSSHLGNSYAVFGLQKKR